MAETINDRMEQLVTERFAGNKAAFAKAIGLHPSAISSYLSQQRRSKPNIDMVTSIIVKLKVDPLWLLTGEESAKKVIHTEGELSPATDSGDIEVNVGDAVLRERIKHLERLLDEKEKRIADKEEMIKMLKGEK